LQGCNFKLGCM